MEWWRDARFGLFIHWGLYSIPAGKWGGRTDHGEWIRDSAQIELPEYEPLLARFDPVKFDAEAWASAAQAAGMRYVVITSKHHDGFALYDSNLTTWDVASTPFRRDILRELADACARHDLRFCTYHSIMDWHHPDYLPRRPWEKRPVGDARFERYEIYLHGQVSEIVERYHPAVMWFDGEWESTWTHERGVRLFDLCRKLDARMIVNNRVDVNRSGMGGFSRDPETRGDFATPEQEIPATGLPGVDWETCMTMNDHWGWNAADPNWKSSRELVRNLCDIASKGGNFLLNVGPTALGEFPPQALERLADLGAWMKQNGESIRGTSASPFETLSFGRCTTRVHGDSTTLYLMVFDPPAPSANGRIELDGLANDVRSAAWLGEPARKLRAERSQGGVAIELGSLPAGETPVIALEISGRPQVHRAPVIEASSDIFVEPLQVRLIGNVGRAVLRYTLDGSEPRASSPAYTGPFLVAEDCTLRARSFEGSRAMSAIRERSFKKVEPKAAFAPLGRRPGLIVARYPGSFDVLPDFKTLEPAARYMVRELALPPGPVEENVARRFEGLVELPRAGVWRFALRSDDGSKLYIDEDCVIDNDGLHGSVEKQADVALARGAHKLAVEWFNKTGGADLTLRAGLAGDALLPLAREALGHDVPVGDGEPSAEERTEAPGDRAREPR